MIELLSVKAHSLSLQLLFHLLMYGLEDCWIGCKSILYLVAILYAYLPIGGLVYRMKVKAFLRSLMEIYSLV